MIGTVLIKARLRRKWSQRELGRRAGLSHKTVQYWEAKQEVDMQAYAIKRIAKAFGWRISGHPSARARHGVLNAKSIKATSSEGFTSAPATGDTFTGGSRVTCGARTRMGTLCRAKSEPGRDRS